MIIAPQLPDNLVIQIGHARIGAGIPLGSLCENVEALTEIGDLRHSALEIPGTIGGLTADYPLGVDAFDAEVGAIVCKTIEFGAAGRGSPDNRHFRIRSGVTDFPNRRATGDQR